MQFKHSINLFFCFDLFFLHAENAWGRTPATLLKCPKIGVYEEKYVC